MTSEATEKALAGTTGTAHSRPEDITNKPENESVVLASGGFK